MVVASLWTLTLSKKGGEERSQEGVELMGANGEREREVSLGLVSM